MDPHARFHALFTSTYAAVKRYAHHRGLSAQDADDLVAETFTVAWRRLDQVPDDDPLPWLFAVARNHWRNRVRKSRREADLLRRLPPADVPTVMPEEHGGPSIAQIRAALDSLGEGDRASVVRTRMRTSGDERKYVELEGETWRLERGVWRVDAWDMERLIDEERRVEPDQAQAKLRAAVALYRGEFSDDAYFGWAQPARERHRALFLRASARLAERLNDAGERDDALATLDRAIEIEPLCEDLYGRRW